MVTSSDRGGGVVGGASVNLRRFLQWLLRMSPVEGCPTVFQMIWSVAPGLHQFKFLVDGEWRHDEHQPYVTTTEFGIVNTAFMIVEPNYIDGLNPKTPTRSTDMDEDGEDNNAFRHMVGLPSVGKYTLFNTLTKLSISTENFPFCTIEPNEARVNIPDERFDWLLKLFKPKSDVCLFIVL